MLGKKERSPPYYFLFTSHSLEHRGVNTEGCQWRPK